MKMQQGETDPIHTITDYNSELSLLQIKPKKLTQLSIILTRFDPIVKYFDKINVAKIKQIIL